MQRLIYLLSPLNKEGTYPLPMISFSLTTKNIDFSSFDTLLFTSKQAVVSANSIDKKWKDYPCIAIGKATKKRIEALGGKVIFSPKEFYAKNLAKDIQHFFSDKKILYLRPKEISFDSKGYLERSGIKLQEQIIYETSCVSYGLKEKPKKNAIIIFTSPSTIKCFFKNFDWDETYTAVLIGKATKKHLPTYCDYVLANKPLISACIERAEEILKLT